MNRVYISIFILLLGVSCTTTTKKEVDVSNIKVTVNIDRFEQKFYTANKKTLPNIEKEYPYLFPIKNDSIWLNKIKNEAELFQETQNVFKNIDTVKKHIINLFKHVKYYHSSFKPPKIITLITNLDYENKVIYADSLLFVSLDMYLGKNSNVYSDFPKYLSQNFNKSQLVVDIATAISERYFIPDRSRQFLNLIINEGKKMYLLDRYLPTFSDAQKMGYTQDQLGWAIANESQLWKYFIENKLLYSTNADLLTRFITNAPFSKFYIDIDKESPGRIGVWLGWQIVRSYMNNNNVTLQELLQTNAEEIFKKSKYKPKK
ncbi:gliding motility lipoprotein GldB [Lutibacter profundi]|uniref:Gliding motility lipoprotein GldB n=1 Tax=Lutibacter profundi TaxID=1622118 RepID=A0A0X8G6C6_9FLAO|nr:gliding motility lipoprotein GldB [Lutibacter profundi]AMC10921.1 gliding motility lipoprotein GldB [Lutibacter profundi]